MFGHEGPARSDRHNQILAGYLAMVGGFVNSAGFVLIGSFTSHVTGNVGRFSNDMANGQLPAAAAAATMVTVFLAGAFIASMIIESNYSGRIATSYATALLLEAAVLLLFTATSKLTPAAHPRLLDLEAAILCGAMGMQNSLVTRLSGAVVRTTHLTGVVTDVGIEAARWFRWWRSTLAGRLHWRLSVGRNPAVKPARSKLALLLTISVAFTLGAVAGGVLAVRLLHVVMLIPSAAVTACGLYALLSARPSTEAAIGPDSRR